MSTLPVHEHTLAIQKSVADFSYVSVGFGMVLGVLLGLIPIPVPGVGVVSLGIGGGPLIVALIVGRLRRTGPISWVMPLPANIVLRNFGLSLPIKPSECTDDGGHRAMGLMRSHRLSAMVGGMVHLCRAQGVYV